MRLPERDGGSSRTQPTTHQPKLEMEGKKKGAGTEWLLREDLEFVEVAGQLEEAVVGVRHGEVDPDEARGEDGGDPGAERGLPDREPVLPPHPLLLLLRESGRGPGEGRSGRKKMKFGEGGRAFFGSLSSLSFLSPAAFRGQVYMAEEGERERTEKDWNILSLLSLLI